MKKFDMKTFNDNKKFFIITIVIIGVFLLLSFIFTPNNNLIETEIPKSGTSEISKLVINEISTNNNGTIMANDGGLYDWIELYNGKSSNVDLTNYSLSDTNDEIKWIFPKGTVIKSKEYLVVFLGGIKTNGLIANFKLSSKGGENLVLRNSNKKIIDAIETKVITSSQVMARQSDGSWSIYGVATPGQSNTMEGFNNYITNLEKESNPSLQINEILPNNSGHFKNSFGEYSGYIELKNIGDIDIELKEYALSDDENKPFKYSLPDITLGKGKIFIIYTSNRNTSINDEYHASFKLSNKNGHVLLSHLNKLVENVKYESIANGLALVKEDKKFITTSIISPGFSNNKDGIEDYQKKYLKLSDGLIISEVMTSNYSYMPHNSNSYYDWIELYNNSKEDINLKDYCLSKSDGTCTEKLPDITIKSKSYYVLMASGDSKLSTNTYKHVGFKIGDNDAIYLFKDSKIIDAIFVPLLDPGYSYGKALNYGCYYYSNPSPNNENGNGLMAIALPPTINTVGGIYNNVDNVLVTISGEGTIYYTTNGSIPNTSSNKYSEPIKLTKTTVIKAISVNSNKRTSSPSTTSYIINENHTLPVMSVTIEPGDFSYLNSNAWETGIEKGAYAEFYEKDDSFSVPCGLKLFGGTTRGPAKKSYALKFRKMYGEGTLNYQVFENRDYSTFDSLVLRTGSQDERGDGYTRAIIRDILGTSLVDGTTKVYVQAYKSIILYINGNYRGIYFIREKVDSAYVANNFNISDDGNTDLLRIDGELKSGTKNSYFSLASYVANNDQTSDSYYNYIDKHIDLDSFIDFWIAENYVANNDIVNMRYFRDPDLDDGRWKFVFYDLDWAWYNYDKNYYEFASSPSGMTVNGYTTVLFRNISQNPKFQKRYLERLSNQMKTIWNKDNILKKMDEIYTEINPEIKRNHERWNYNYSEFENSVEILKNFINKREDYLLKYTKSYFKLSDQEMKEYFGEL